MAVPLPRSANTEQVVATTIARVCPLTSFRVTTDSSGDIKRQFKNDWTMTHDASAIAIVGYSVLYRPGERRSTERRSNRNETTREKAKEEDPARGRR